MAKIFELGKSLKLPKMQFHEKKLDLFDFTNFLAWTFLNFLARCVFFITFETSWVWNQNKISKEAPTLMFITLYYHHLHMWVKQ